jgi:tetratricopeptide (TPR) repeat protein
MTHVMRPPLRIILPIALAVGCAAIVLGIFAWQLALSTSMLERAGRETETTIPTPGATPPTLLAPVDPHSDALLQLRRGDLAVLQGDWSMAQTAYAASVQAGGGIPAMRKLALAQLQQRDFTGLRATMDAWRRAGGRSEDLLLVDGLLLLRTGKNEELTALLDRAGDVPQAHYLRALRAIASGDDAMAQQEIGAVNAGWEPVLRSYAKTLAAAYDEYALFPDSPRIHLQTLLARALAQVQECELALPILQRVTTEQDDYRDAWIVRGYCELTGSHATEAVASLERAYALDPEKPAIQYFLGRAQAAVGNHENALTYLQYALRNGFEPESDVRRWIAQESLAMGNPLLALQQFDVLTGLPDATLETYAQYVSAAIAAGNVEEARGKAAAASAKWPDDPAAKKLVDTANSAKAPPMSAPAQP